MRRADAPAVSFDGDVGGTAALIALLLLDMELARRGEIGTGVSSARGELGLNFEDPVDGVGLSCEGFSTSGVDVGVMEAAWREEKVIGL